MKNLHHLSKEALTLLNSEMKYFLVLFFLFCSCSKTKNLNKVGYKILLDIIYSSDSSIKIVDVDINFKTRKTGHSKMNLMVLIKLIPLPLKGASS